MKRNTRAKDQSCHRRCRSVLRWHSQNYTRLGTPLLQFHSGRHDLYHSSLPFLSHLSLESKRIHCVHWNPVCLPVYYEQTYSSEGGTAKVPVRPESTPFTTCSSRGADVTFMPIPHCQRHGILHVWAMRCEMLMVLSAFGKLLIHTPP